MEVLKFTLGGKFAFFKKPDVNTYLYFTYGNIHKIALLGMFGAILGYNGYNQMDFAKRYKKDFDGIVDNKDSEYPEFYYKLKHLNIAIVPKDIYIPKKIQVFNNSVGYASKEQGGNLIIKEQWLENPLWDIYLAIENEEGKKLARALLGNNFIYIPYLGKNDHPADISDAKLFHDISEINNPNKINGLFLKKDFQIIEDDNLDDLDYDNIPTFKYEEKLPIELEEKTNKYELKSFIYTNANLKRLNEVKAYRLDDINIVFF